MSEKKTPRICTCVQKNDVDMDRIERVARRARLSPRALVMALGELEATDHRRDCDWYAIFLEKCEAFWIFEEQEV